MFRNHKTIAAAALLSVVAAGPALAASSAPAPAAPAPSRAFNTMTLAGEVPLELMAELAPAPEMDKLKRVRRSAAAGMGGGFGAPDKVRFEATLYAQKLGAPAIAIVTLPREGVQFAVPAKISAFNNPVLLDPQAHPEGLPFGVDATAFRNLPLTYFRVEVAHTRMLFFGAPLSPEATKTPANPAIFPAVYELTMFDLGDGGAVVDGEMHLNR